MIFSDLYVRFYSQAFKFVDAQGPGELDRFFHAIYGPDVTTAWTGEKYALWRLGVIDDPLAKAQKMEVLTEARRREIDQALDTHREALL